MASQPAVLNAARGTVDQESQKRKARSIQMCLEVLCSGWVPGTSSEWSQCHLSCAENMSLDKSDLWFHVIFLRELGSEDLGLLEEASSLVELLGQYL